MVWNAWSHYIKSHKFSFRYNEPVLKPAKYITVVWAREHSQNAAGIVIKWFLAICYK